MERGDQEKGGERGDKGREEGKKEEGKERRRERGKPFILYDTRGVFLYLIPLVPPK